MRSFIVSLLVVIVFALPSYAMPSGPPAGSPIINSSIRQKNSVMNIDTGTISQATISTFTNNPSFPVGITIAGSKYNSVGSSPLNNFGIVNVKDYGAFGDGFNEDGPAILAAYNILVTRGGGTLYIPAGTYLDTATPLKPASNISITGDGARTTIINWNGSGFWLDNQSTGTIMTHFVVQGMTINCNNASGNHFCRLGLTGQTFSESCQHIDCSFLDLQVVGNAAIIANTTGMKFNTMIRTRIEHCIFLNFDVTWDFQKFDEGWINHNEIENEKTYAIYMHNDTNNVFSDETTFIDNHIVVSTGSTAGIYISQAENLRFFNTYMDAGGGGSIPLGYYINSVHNMTIDGGTLNSETTNFYLTNVRNLTIANQQLQNPDQSPAPQQHVVFSYGSNNDLTGTGGPYADPNYGAVRVINCGYAIANGFKNTPGVSVTSHGKFGGESHFGGPMSDSSQVYASQVLDRNGSLGLLKETGLVLSPLNSNLYLNGSAPQAIQVVADSNASTGYALKSSSSNIFMDIPYPADILPGSYELIARVRTSSGVPGNFFAVYWDNILKENFGGINTTTTYKLINLRFNFSTISSTTTLSIRMGDGTTDLYLDYAVLRPCANSIALQTFVPNDLTGVGAGSVPGFKMIYSNTIPASGNWNRGDLILTSTPSAGGFVGWTCTSSGAPGTWKTFGAVTP